MPLINGRYYMNPQYGAALEQDRAADAESVRVNGAPKPSWLDRFLGFVHPEEDQQQIGPVESDSGAIFREPAGNGNALVAANQTNQGTQHVQEQNPKQQTPADIAAAAGKYEGSTDWAFNAKKGAFGPGTNKCNAFVGDVAKEAGTPAAVTGSDGKSRYPLAAEWADKNTKIADWRVLPSGETPQPGDVAAYKLSGGGTSYSGHSGIVVSVDSDGTVHGLAAHENVVGSDDKFQPDSKQNVVVFRRYTGGH